MADRVFDSRAGTGPRRRLPGRLLSVCLRVLAGVLVAGLAALVAGGFWLSETGSGQRWLKNTLERAVDDPDGLRLRIGALEGSVLSDLVVRDVVLQDKNGVWLSLERARLAWSPLALLTGRLSVTALEADTLQLERLPELPESPPEETGTSGTGFDPALLGRISVGLIRIGPVTLGPSVLGEPLTVSLEGHTEGKGDALRSVVRFGAGPETSGTQVAATGLQADLEVLYRAEPSGLDLTLSVSEPPGGVLGRLAGFPKQAGMALAIEGHGPLSGWDGTLRFRMDDILDVEGTATLSLTAPDPSVRLEVSAAPLPKAHAPMSAVLGTRATLGTEVHWTGSGLVRIPDLKLDAASAGLSARGQVDLGGGTPSFDLETSAVLNGPSLVSLFLDGFALDRADLSLRASGTVAHADADLHLEALGAALDGIVGADRLEVDATLRPRKASLFSGAAPGDLTLKATTEGFVLPVAGGFVETALGGSLQLEAAGGLDVAPDVSRLDWTGVSLDLGGQDVTLKGQGDFDILALRLGPFDARLEVPQVENLAAGITGTARLEARTEGFTLWPLAGELAVDGGGALEPRDPAGALWHLFGASPALQVRAVFPEQPHPEALRIEDLDLTFAGARAQGHVILGADDGGLDALLRASVDDPASFGAGIGGDPVTLDLSASGTLRDPDLNLALVANRLEGPGVKIEGLSLTAAVQSREGGPRGQVEGGGALGGQALKINVPFQVTQDFARLQVKGGQVLYGKAAARLGADLDLKTLSGSKADLQVDLPDLSLFSGAGAPDGLRGALALKATLAPEQGGKPAMLEATLSSSGLALGDVKPGVLSARLGVRDPFGRRDLEATVGLNGGQAGPVNWSQVALVAKGTPEALDATLEVEGLLNAGEAPRPLSARAGAHLDLAGADRQIVVAPLDVRIGAVQVRQTTKATLHLKDGGALQLDGLDLAIDTGRLSGSGTFGGAAGETLTLRLSGIPLALVETFAPGLGIEGRLEGTLSLGGSAAHPSGRLALSVPDLRSTASASRTLSARLEAKLDRALDARLTLEGAGEPLVATARLPTGAGVSLSARTPLQARVQGAMDLADLLAFTPLIEHRASGLLTVDLRVGGTLGAPVVQGHVSTRNARYENLLTGTLLTGLDVEATADKGRTLTLEMRARDGDQGTVLVDGHLALADPARPRGVVDIRTLDAMLVRRDDVEAGLNSDLHVELEGGGGAVTGTVTSTRVLVRLVNTLGASIPSLEVVEKGSAAGKTGAGTPETALRQTDRAGEPSEAGARPLTLDLHVVLPGHVKVTGQGVDTEWRGDLRVGGTASAPSVVGSIENVRGQLELVGRVFSLKNSVVRFDGGKKIDPVLDIRATNKAGRIDATVRVTGTASSPAISFEADPPLPEDEVVAHVLFGKSSGELSAIEAVQLARALGQLRDFGSGGPDIMGKIRDAIGLDVLRFGESADGSSTLEAGAYLRENVYVGVVQGMEPGESAVHVEVELTPEISLESQVGASGTGAAGVLWKWDY